MMRVLYIWNTAGVFTPVARWLSQNGHEARIIMRKEYDPYGSSISEHALIVEGAKPFYDSILTLLHEFKPDVIHLNSIWQLMPFVRLHALSIPIIFQYHGPHGLGKKKARHEEALLADKIIVSSKNLQRFGDWYDRPVDSLHFQYKGGRKPKTALMMYCSQNLIDERDLARQFCNERGIELTIINRDHEAIPFEDMPDFLSKFEYYLDFKGHIKIPVLSKAALEALQCGCLVVMDASLEVVTDISDIVKNNLPEDYEKLYNSISRSKWQILQSLPRLVALLLTSKRGLFYIGYSLKKLLS